MTTDDKTTPDGLSEATTTFESKTDIQRLYPQALAAHDRMERSDDTEADGSWAAYDALRAQIMRSPACGPKDVAIKLRLFASMGIVEHPERLPEEGDNNLGYLRNAILDLERLDGETLTEPDAMLEKLAVSLHAACNASYRMQDVLDDARLKVARDGAKMILAESGEAALTEAMLQIPAAGLRGVRAKIKAMLTPGHWKSIKAADDDDFDPCTLDTAIFHSVVMDLERLAGGSGEARP